MCKLRLLQLLMLLLLLLLLYMIMMRGIVLTRMSAAAVAVQMMCATRVLLLLLMLHILMQMLMVMTITMVMRIVTIATICKQHVSQTSYPRQMHDAAVYALNNAATLHASMHRIQGTISQQAAAIICSSIRNKISIALCARVCEGREGGRGGWGQKPVELSSNALEEKGRATRRETRQ